VNDDAHNDEPIKSSFRFYYSFLPVFVIALALAMFLCVIGAILINLHFQ
jgi:hypothetical protein